MMGYMKAALCALLLAAVLFCERLTALYTRVVFFMGAGAMRYVARGPVLARVRAVPEGVLCACDCITPNGSILKTLGRGMRRVDVEGDTRDMKRFHERVLVVEPHVASAPQSAMTAARQFLMQRCAGYAATSATVSEVVRLMEAASGQDPGSFSDRLTVILADFKEMQLAGDDLVCPAC